MRKVFEMMDWELNSKNMKNTYLSLNQISKHQAPLIFFYDESNNIRRFKNNNGVFNNDKYCNFSLGGLVLHKNVGEMDFKELFDILRFRNNDNFSEFKLKHFLVKKEKDFIKRINSKKLCDLLEYLNSKQGIYIHFSILNFFYYGIVDIVDTLFEVNEYYDKGESDDLKSFVYGKMILEYEYWAKEFWKYQYPNIPKEKMPSFLNDLIAYFARLRTYGKKEKRESDKFIQLCSKRKRKLESMPHILLSRNESNSLVDTLSHFYQERVMVYDKAYHMFDEEDTIIEEWEKSGFYAWGDKRRFEFCKSETDIKIQISDVLAGLIAKLFDFLAGIDSIDKLKSLIQSISKDSNSYKVLKNLFLFIDKSETYDSFFLKYFAPKNDIEKFRFLYNYMLDY